MSDHEDTRTETKIERHFRLFLQYKKAGHLYDEQASKHHRKFTALLEEAMKN